MLSINFNTLEQQIRLEKQAELNARFKAIEVFNNYQSRLDTTKSSYEYQQYINSIK